MEDFSTSTATSPHTTQLSSEIRFAVAATLLFTSSGLVDIQQFGLPGTEMTFEPVKRPTADQLLKSEYMLRSSD